MKLIKRLFCFFGYHWWTVSKSTGLDLHVCSVCDKKEFRYGQI